MRENGEICKECKGKRESIDGYMLTKFILISSILK